MTKKKTLLCATNNQGKLREFTALFPNYSVLGLKDLNINADIVEDADTFEGNALIKLRFLAKIHPDIVIIADDSGLCVNALNNAPGVISARYAGPQATDEDNIVKLLSELSSHKDRSAHFVCCLALYKDGLEYLFHGKVHGTIATASAGAGGFGYDPVFIPEGYNETFAALDPKVKKQISHRRKAVNNLYDFLSR